MTHIPSNPHMRLVGQHDPEATQVWTVGHAHSSIAAENLSASTMEIGDTDPRWQLARRAYSQLQQGPLTPNQRDMLVQEAGQLGLRPFDASLIIAIAQNQTRNGQPLHAASTTLQLVPPASPIGNKHGRRLSFAIALALGVSGLLLMWLATW